MKNRGRIRQSGIMLFALALAMPAHSQVSTRYFRPVGPGGGLAAAGEYNWNTVTAHWYDAETGGTARAWQNGSAAFLVLDDEDQFANGAVVHVTGNINLAGFQTTRFDNFNHKLTIRSASVNHPVRFTFADGSALHAGGDRFGAGRTYFENVAFAGNVNIHRSHIGFRDVTFIDSPTITISGGDGAAGGSATFSGDATGARIIMDTAAFVLAPVNTTISHLEGRGRITAGNPGVANNTVLTLDQAANTAFALTQHFSIGAAIFRKAGNGNFLLSGGRQVSLREFHVDGGGLFIEGVGSVDARSILSPVNVAENTVLGGTFGLGVGSGSRGVVLAGPTSTLSPGMPTMDASGNMVYRAGTLTIHSDHSNHETIVAANGGTFHFYLDGDDGNGNLVNSQLVVSGASRLTLGGVKTVKLFGLNSGLIEMGTPYTLINLRGHFGPRTEGWNNMDLWRIDESGLAAAGYAVQSFGWNGDFLTLQLAPKNRRGNW